MYNPYTPKGGSILNNIIIGTAGHVDHGKTALIKALTGIDTDRLKEEKKRGITIDLGFASLPLKNGQTAGIVDVPGHEKFISNMLAGAGGVDLALLVIAADDGVMPQTREHLGILSLLGVKSGIIALTKADLVESEWIELISTDIRECVAGTFLENAPIKAVSAFTGHGLDELKALINDMAEAIASKNSDGAFRIPVDRVFSVDGFGTVITGTITEGCIREGSDVEIYPGGTLTRVRNLQVHSKDVTEAYAGQRVAVNLASIKRETVIRGDTLATPSSMLTTMMLDVKLRILPDSSRIVRNGSRLHFYHGSYEALCKLVLLDRDELAPGEEGFAQLRFTQKVATKKDDRFVLRFYSPLETVGGGVVLNPNPKRHRRHNENILDSLRVREHGSLSENLLQTIADMSPQLSPLSGAQKLLGLTDRALIDELQHLSDNGHILFIDNKTAIDTGYRKKLEDDLQHILSEYHAANPLQDGIRREELRSRLLPGRDAAIADRLLTVLAKSGIFVVKNQKAALPSFEPKGGAGDNILMEQIEQLYKDARYTPPNADEISAKFPGKTAAVKKVHEALLSKGALVSVAPQIYFHESVYSEAAESVPAFIEHEGQITLAQTRNLFGTSRKFALALLEYFDRRGVTKKIGDARVLGKILK